MKTSEQLKAENDAIRSMLARGSEQELLANPNVLHVSVGLKETNGTVSDQLCVRVYVKHKKDRASVPADELIPTEVNGVPTDVNTVGEFEFSDDNTKYRPIKGGIQISNRIVVLNDAGTGTEMSRGTLGCMAIDTTDDAPVMLSNWHVLYGSAGRTGDKVYQPPPTSVPPAQLGDLPVRPTDDADKVGVLRRKEISSNCDGAIATIDVSSCCHCCGIHYSNEINGLSVGGRPPRNTIVGDQRAVSGMPVFKVGKSTGRTEGRVVDDNHPSFSITKDGTTHTFTGQIAIQNINSAQPFSTHGDSGSVIINLDNKIVGLLFASGRNIPISGTPQPFITIANHISDVFAALKIRIPYSPDVKVISAETLRAVPTVFEAPIPEPYRVLRKQLQDNEVTAKLFAIGQRHSDEVTYLVNHCRPVTVAWRRAQGPAFLATVMGAVREGHSRIPPAIKGVTLTELLRRMQLVLSQNGSPALRETMNSARVNVEGILADCASIDDLIAHIASDQDLILTLKGIHV
jgi:hypothetical protein